MSIQLNLFFLVTSIITFTYIVMQIRKHKLNIDDSIAWIIWSIVLLVISIFPQIPIWMASLMGFEATSNFILCLFVFVLYMMLFFQNIKLSGLKERNKELTQKMSIYVYKQEKGK